MNGLNKIWVGDTVSVHFHGSKMTLCSRGRVASVPSGPGDSWIIRDLDTDVVHYISEPCTVTKEARP